MSEDSLRASDADREATVTRLQSAFAEGRLELAEIDERTAAAYAAKTLGDLAALTRDLPEAGSAPVAPQPSHQPHQQQHHDPDIWQWAKFGLPPIIVINFLVWLGIGLSGNWVHPWWIWIMVAWLGGAFGGPGGRGRIGHRGPHGHRGRRDIDRRQRRDRDRLDRRDDPDEDDPQLED